MEVQKNIGLKLVDHFSDGTSLAEEPELDEWVKSSAENEKTYEEYRRIWLGSYEIAQKNKFDSGNAWSIVNKEILTVNTYKNRLYNIAYAALGVAASLLITFGLAFYTNIFSSKGEIVQLSTNNGSHSFVVLPDGTSVTLNAGTNLTYQFDNLNKTREVKFSGEGFFEVAKSKNPFIIHTQNGLKIKVLGTKFNLKAYSDDNTIRTTLIEGKVDVYSPHNKRLTLSPGQIASYNDTTDELDYTSGQPFQDFGWVNNKLYMDNMSLQEVSKILERWYDVNIVINENELGNKIHYTGVLKEETIHKVLDALCSLSEITYQINGKKIIINKKLHAL